MDPSSHLNIVGSAASIYGALKTFSKSNEIIFEDAAEKILKRVADEGEAVTAHTALASMVSRLDSRILDVLYDNIEAEIEDVSDQMRGAGPAKAKLLGKRLSKAICRFPEVLQDANGGTLNGEPWAEKHWLDFQCDSPLKPTQGI